MLTDGIQTPDPDAEDPIQIANEIRAEGTSIVVVYIGKPGKVVTTSLNHIAGMIIT